MVVGGPLLEIPSKQPKEAGVTKTRTTMSDAETQTTGTSWWSTWAPVERDRDHSQAGYGKDPGQGPRLEAPFPQTAT